DEMLAALTAKALPLAAAACAEVCARHLEIVRVAQMEQQQMQQQQLQQLQSLQQQQLQQLQQFQIGETTPHVEASARRTPGGTGGRSHRSASPLRRALDFTGSMSATQFSSMMGAERSPGVSRFDSDVPAEALSVMKRVRNAVIRSRQSPEQLFQRFCRSGGGNVQGPLMTRSDFVRVIGTFEPNLEQEMVARLWRALITEGSESLDFESFQQCFYYTDQSPVSGPGHTLTRFSSSSQLDFSLQQESAALAQLLESSPAAGVHGRTDRPALSPSSFSPASFKPFSRPNGPDSPPFRAAEVPPRLPNRVGLPRQLTAEEAALFACLHRLGRGLQAESLTVNAAFVLYDENLERMLSLDKFVEACQHHRLPLSQHETE
ncbi:unnamed protein product, partial [Polarella glacialis]